MMGGKQDCGGRNRTPDRAVTNAVLPTGPIPFKPRQSLIFLVQARMHYCYLIAGPIDARQPRAGTRICRPRSQVWLILRRAGVAVLLPR
jgi:hypothetical protein